MCEKYYLPFKFGDSIGCQCSDVVCSPDPKHFAAQMVQLLLVANRRAKDFM